MAFCLCLYPHVRPFPFCCVKSFKVPAKNSLPSTLVLAALFNNCLFKKSLLVCIPVSIIVFSKRLPTFFPADSYKGWPFSDDRKMYDLDHCLLDYKGKTLMVSFVHGAISKLRERYNMTLVRVEVTIHRKYHCLRRGSVLKCNVTCTVPEANGTLILFYLSH